MILTEEQKAALEAAQLVCMKVDADDALCALQAVIDASNAEAGIEV